MKVLSISSQVKSVKFIESPIFLGWQMMILLLVTTMLSGKTVMAGFF